MDESILSVSPSDSSPQDHGLVAAMPHAEAITPDAERAKQSADTADHFHPSGASIRYIHDGRRHLCRIGRNELGLDLLKHLDLRIVTFLGILHQHVQIFLGDFFAGGHLHQLIVCERSKHNLIFGPVAAGKFTDAEAEACRTADCEQTHQTEDCRRTSPGDEAGKRIADCGSRAVPGPACADEAEIRRCQNHKHRTCAHVEIQVLQHFRQIERGFHN